MAIGLKNVRQTQLAWALVGWLNFVAIAILALALSDIQWSGWLILAGALGLLLITVVLLWSLLRGEEPGGGKR